MVVLRRAGQGDIYYPTICNDSAKDCRLGNLHRIITVLLGIINRITLQLGTNGIENMALRRLRVLVAQELGVPVSNAVLLINNGRVKVNGAVSRPTTIIGEADTVTCDNVEICTKTELAYVIFNKPRGIECTMNESIESNLLTVFKHPLRLYPVGRLDKESEGLLLMINDGKLYHEVAHADNKKEKEYYVEVHKAINEEFLSVMRSGVKILNTVTDPCDVLADPMNEKAFRIILRQGMNRQIRRMCYNLGFSVHKLVRTRIMHLELNVLKPGEWRNLEGKELDDLLRLKQ